MSQASFLPEDYIAQRAERRSVAINLTLFVVVILSVVGAFFVQYRQRLQVKREQQEINERYAEAARRIEELRELETRKAELLNKAEITQALVERVPRSVLLAEFTNRMPDSVSMEEFELKSTPMKATPSSLRASETRSLADKKRIPTKADEAIERKVEAPKYLTTIALVGVAPTDVHVSEFITNLTACPLLEGVDLSHTRATTIEGREVRKFKIETRLNPNADAKMFEPLRMTRSLRDPTEATVEFDAFDAALTQVELDDEERH